MEPAANRLHPACSGDEVAVDQPSAGQVKTQVQDLNEYLTTQAHTFGSHRRVVTTAQEDDTRVRFAYADPPYPGQSGLYSQHSAFAGEVDHAELIVRLSRDYPDGWALSTSARALRDVLLLCPPDVWIAAWHKTNTPPIRTTRRFIWSWEPVIVRGGRAKGDAPNVRDCFASAMAPASFPGMKPPAFSRWVLDLLGVLPGDQVDDLFPGTGAVSDEIRAVTNSTQLWDQAALIDAEGRSSYRDRVDSSLYRVARD